MKYTVYVLSSLRVRKSYVGYTKNLERRLVQHNKGKSSFSSNFAPWKVIYTEVFNNELEARSREKYLKSASGRKRILKPLFEV